MVKILLEGKIMPIYEYICPDCGHKFDLLKTFGQIDEEVVCPRCNKSAERQLSVFGHSLKDPNELPSSWRKT
tara:strand:- start:1 stop:216 length:216 start_codon:yes stop_codon:yes gene_type:complete